ncbi:hypothetical protein LOD99_2447 [Oopsacas minuta]|uniref:3'-5' exonuclease domain-containing protein n=1 Tax=Oopsacas minuta TaxID=111878 RepID=A0AAV7K1T3_9METZ|nr:hypothetical protein LOD99_2447 [Oopsacas minuta]
MYFKVICATLVCSTIVLIGFLRVHRWNWLRIKRPKEEAIETTLPISRTNTPPIDQTEEVKAKPMLCPGPSTQHLQHDGVDVYVISSMTECEEILSSIPRQNLCLLGFDCEWAQSYHLDEIVQAARGDCLSAFVYPIALIQIATMDSRCYLIRLSQMQNQIPPSLVDILLDEKCLKFGVSSLNDLNRIKNHYLIHPKGAVDLRHLAYHRMIG